MNSKGYVHQWEIKNIKEGFMSLDASSLKDIRKFNSVQNEMPENLHPSLYFQIH